MKKLTAFLALIGFLLVPVCAQATSTSSPDLELNLKIEAKSVLQAMDAIVHEQFSEAIDVMVLPQDKEEILRQLDELAPKAEMLAKLVYREAGGMNSKMEQAGVIWCVLNRVDCESSYGNSISKVVKAKHQFAWVSKTPVRDDLLELANDVLARWLLEKAGYENVGRVLPNDYYFFAGRKGHNWFRKTYKSRNYWDWSLDNPYE